MTERKLIHQQANELVNQAEAQFVKSEGDLLLEADEAAIARRAEMKRRVRKIINYRQRRDPLFI